MDTQKNPCTGLIQEINQENFVDIWLQIFGIEAPNKEVEKEVLRRILKEIELIRELNKPKEFAPNVVISDVLWKISRTLCKFETRVFPMEWELPPDCFEEHALDSPHFSIENFKGEWNVILKTRCILLRKPKESLIGSHLPRVMDSDTKAMFQSAHRFFTNLIGDAVMSIFECIVNWIILDEESEISRVLCSLRRQQNQPKESTRKRGSSEEQEMKRKTKRREVEDVGIENIPKKAGSATENHSIDFGNTTSEEDRFIYDHKNTIQLIDRPRTIRKSISNEPTPICSRESSAITNAITTDDSYVNPPSSNKESESDEPTNLMDAASSSPFTSQEGSSHNPIFLSDDENDYDREDEEDNEKYVEGIGTVSGHLNLYAVAHQSQSNADNEFKTLTPQSRVAAHDVPIQYSAHSHPPIRISFTQKFVPVQIPSAFEDFYKRPRYPSLKHRPKLLHMSRTHNAAENERFWQPGKKMDGNLFGEHLRKILIARNNFVTRRVYDKLSLAVSIPMLERHVPRDLIGNHEVAVSAAKVQTYVRETMTLRFSMVDIYPDYFPTNWFVLNMKDIDEFNTTDEDIDVSGDSSALYAFLQHKSNEIEIKKEAHFICQKMMCDLVRTVFVMKLDADRAPLFFYDGALDIIPEKSHPRSVAESSTESY